MRDSEHAKKRAGSDDIGFHKCTFTLMEYLLPNARFSRRQSTSSGCDAHRRSNTRGRVQGPARQKQGCPFGVAPQYADSFRSQVHVVSPPKLNVVLKVRANAAL